MTFLFSDIEGSTELSRRHGAAYGDLRAEHRSLLERAGDHAMCVFSSAKNAIVAAAAIGEALRTRDWVQGTEKPEVSAAVHSGRVAGLAGGELGAPALRVTRLCASAQPGQVLVSHSTQTLLEGETLATLALRDLGERELPGMTAARVYELVGGAESS